jgi:site-specific DNA-methyltransferase (adenine-specific)
VRPYFSDGNGITLYHGAAEEVLPTLESGSVDLLLTDPPYGVGYVTSWRSRNDPLAVPIAGDRSVNALRDVLPLIDQLLRPDRHAYLFAAPLRIGEVMEAVADFWKIKNVLVWDKGDEGSIGDLRAGYGWNWEPIIYASKGRRDLNGARPRSIYRYDWHAHRDPVHPTVKPTGLLTWLISKSTQPQERVLDPFAGSGTTLMAAKQLGRSGIGVEVEERYAEIAARRLSQEVLPLEVLG